MVGSAVGHQRRVDRELSVFQAPRLTHNAYVLTPSRKLSGTNKVKSHRRDSRCAEGEGEVVFGRATRHHLSTTRTLGTELMIYTPPLQNRQYNANRLTQREEL